MSEYQYYEFRAIDRQLGPTEQQELRALSSRADITASSFVNTYNWGDFKGNPDRLMARYFDLFLYLANWGTRQIAIRIPKLVLDVPRLKQFIADRDVARIRSEGENVILDVSRDELDAEGEGGEGWLDAIAPLRNDLLEGDLRSLYLVWLMSVENEDTPDNTIEPLDGLGPLTPQLVAFANFFCIDRDLVEAAAVRSAVLPPEPSEQEVTAMIKALGAKEKDGYLRRLYDGDPLVRADFRRRCRPATSPGKPVQPRRQAGELRRIAADLAEARRKVEEERRQAEKRREQERETKARKVRIDALKRRGQSAWTDVEAIVAFRNNNAYDQVAVMLADLRELSLLQGTDDEFHRRLTDLRARHKAKRQLLVRLAANGLH
ncbi:hypothetical protein OZ411_18550 [Bradyrhizobium sp. Arg237L]|uniref:hypothetical protein n=1 Tax=Bradyrhizobium sp. Arg237L TaxID=3003352 RepID=UPI00249F79C3|nr:hypothetical protein [Bradyrhizobium sp. Arg237L]MDI4234808.1 hypothetical protein [Bradyrhizobium sp. Arg237L]